MIETEERPADVEAIATLPGVGRYTAGAIAAFAFDQSVPAVDGNIARVLARLLNLRTPVDSAKGQQELWHSAVSLLPTRGDRQLAFLTAVVSAVQSNTTRERWEAGWTVLSKAVDAGVPDVAARAAADLAAMRQPAWPVPATLDAVIDILSLSDTLG